MNGIKYKDSSLDTTNLIDYSTWTIGQTSATGFVSTGHAYENLIVSDFVRMERLDRYGKPLTQI